MKHLILVPCLVAAAPALVFGFSTGPPTKRTGSLTDGGLSCVACHRTYAPANSDPRQKTLLSVSDYTPGQKMTLRISVEHPDANRWGFQLTARLASDDSKAAGTFTVASNVRVRCTDTQDAPCNGAVEFASHTQPSTRLGSNGKNTWDIEWTPPATDVGDIVFYFAGNAANGGNTNAGDVIATGAAVIHPAGGCNLSAAPVISGVKNAASFQDGLAVNGLFSIFGSNFLPAGRARSVAQADVITGSFPKLMECVAVQVGNERMPLTYTSSGQINAQAHGRIVAGESVVVITNPGTANEQRSAAFATSVAAMQPGFFTYAAGRYAAAIHANGSIIGNPAVTPGTTPALPDETITLFLTGLGFTDPYTQPGDITVFAGNVPGTTTVQIGDTMLPADRVTYVGLTPGSISGLYQVNVKLPANAANGDLAVSLRNGSITSPAGPAVYVFK